MREMDWPAPAALPGATIEKDGATITMRAPAGASLVSGDLLAAIAVLAPGACRVGLGGQTGESAHALTIARDRALLVTEKPIDTAPGWHEGGFALTPADDAWCVFEIVGPAAADIVAEGTSADLAAGSPSAAVLFAGRPCLLARTGEAFRLHVEAPFREYMYEWLSGAA